jgi:phosphoribosylformylglycinamidine cyclo-ligase
MMDGGMSYQAAGVDIDKGDRIVDAIKQSVSQTHTAQVLSPIGGFAGLYDLKSLLEDYQHPVMVQSIDGVGTKSIVARMANDYRFLGADLVSATVNDILVCGATPLTLLDYVASDRLNSDAIITLINSIAQSCQQYQISLVGGETAEMPDTYQQQEIDVVGIVTGVVEKSECIDGSTVKAGDVVLGIASSGLHTNGFSLARKVLFEHQKLDIDAYIEALDMTLAEALLAPHVNYLPHVNVLKNLGIKPHAMAHITGGGLQSNLQRVLPAECQMKPIQHDLPKPAIFDLIQTYGQIETLEMQRAFNMGIGYCMVIDCDDVDAAMCAIKAQTTQTIAPIGVIQ